MIHAFKQLKEPHNQRPVPRGDQACDSFWTHGSLGFACDYAYADVETANLMRSQDF